MNFRLVLVLSLTLLVTACGFHLKGSVQIADKFNPVYIESGQLDSVQLALIRKELIRSAAKINVSEQKSKRLKVSLSSLQRRQIASSSLTDVELVQLTMSIQYSVQAESGEYLITPYESRLSVEVELDNANILGQEQTINRAKQRLQRSLILSMISQLSR